MTSLRNRLVLLAAVVLPCMGCDQITKELARSQLTPGVGTEHLGGILTLDFLLLRAGPIHTGIFNLADMQITLAAIALLASAIWPKRSSR